MALAACAPSDLFQSSMAKLAGQPVQLHRPTLAPDGTFVLVPITVSDGTARRWELLVFDFEPGELRSADGQYRNASFSPDGKHQAILVSEERLCDDGDTCDIRQIVEWSPTSRTERELTNFRTDEVAPRWRVYSSDGKAIYYICDGLEDPNAPGKLQWGNEFGQSSGICRLDLSSGANMLVMPTSLGRSPFGGTKLFGTGGPERLFFSAVTSRKLYRQFVFEAGYQAPQGLRPPPDEELCFYVDRDGEVKLVHPTRFVRCTQAATGRAIGLMLNNDNPEGPRYDWELFEWLGPRQFRQITNVRSWLHAPAISANGRVAVVYSNSTRRVRSPNWDLLKIDVDTGQTEVTNFRAALKAYLAAKSSP